MKQNPSIHVGFRLSADCLTSLLLLYQPLFSYPALSLYLTLYEMGKTDVGYYGVDSALLCGLGDEDFVRYRQELERFTLIRTYQGQQLSMVVNRPLSPGEFLAHTTFSRLFAIVCGDQVYKDMSLRFAQRKNEGDLGVEITKPFDLSRLALWDESLEHNFRSVRSEDQTGYSFNVDGFFKSISQRLYPMSLRTERLKQVITEMGSIYKLSYKDMKTCLLSSTNVEKELFDEKRFIYLIERDFGSKTAAGSDNPYELEPLLFLRYKQHDDYVVDADRNLLKSLKENFGFDNKVINVLVEYILDVNDHDLNRAYVEKIAALWKRRQVKTFEDALKQIASFPEKKPRAVKNRKTMPTYSKDSAIDEDVDKLKAEIELLLKKGD